MATDNTAETLEREPSLQIGEMEFTPDPEADGSEAVAEVVETVALGPASAAVADTTATAEPKADAASTVSEPTAPQRDPEFTAMQQRVVALERERLERMRQEEASRDQQHLNQYKAALEAKGYEPDIVEELVAKEAGQRGYQRQLIAQEQTGRAYAWAVRQNERARVAVLQHIAKEHGVPIDVLLSIETDEPREIEYAARTYKAEKALEKLNQAAVKPQRMTGVTGSAGRSMGKEALTDQYIERPDSLTREELKIVFPDRY